METQATLKDWIPLFSSLITPIFVISLVVWFRSDVADFIRIAKKAVEEQGRSIETPWFKIGERAKETDISKLNLGDLSVSLIDHDYDEWVSSVKLFSLVWDGGWK